MVDKTTIQHPYNLSPVNTFNDLRALSVRPSPNQIINVVCRSVVGDGYAGTYYYDPLSTATDDNYIVIKPTKSNGRWIRFGYSSGGGGIQPTTPIPNLSQVLHVGNDADGYRIVNLAAGINPHDAVRIDQLPTIPPVITPGLGDVLAVSNNADGYKITGLGTATNPSDAVRFDQLPSFTTPGLGPVLAISNDADGYTIENLSPGANPTDAATVSQIPTNISGDATGLLTASTVVKLQNNSVQSGIPADGYVLTWVNGSSQWQPKPITATTTVTLAGDVSGPSNSNTVDKLKNIPLSIPVHGADQDGYALTFVNGSSDIELKPITPTTTINLFGDVTGPSTSTTVEAIQNNAVSSASPSTNDVLTWDGAQWEPASIPFPSTPTWAQTLAAGNQSLGTSPLITTGDKLYIGNNSAISGAINFNNDMKMSWRNSTDTLDVDVLRLSAVDSVILGDSSKAKDFQINTNNLNNTINLNFAGNTEYLFDGYHLSLTDNYLSLGTSVIPTSGLVRLGYVSQASSGITFLRGIKDDGTTGASLIKWNSDAANNLTFGASPAGVDAITKILMKATSFTMNVAGTDEYTFSSTIADFTNNALQFGTNPAASGLIRIPNANTGLSGRNAANGADVNLIGINSSDNIVLGHVPVKDETPANDGYVWTYVVANSRMELKPTATSLTLAGDTTGPSGSNTVVKIRNTSLATSVGTVGASQDGYTLTWVNASSEWQPKPITITTTVSLAGDVSGLSNANTVDKLKNIPLSLGSPGATQDGYFLTWINGSSNFQLKPQTAVSSVVMGGDVSGVSSSSTVVKIQNRSVSSSAPSDGYLMIWDQPSTTWVMGNRSVNFGDGYVRFGSGTTPTATSLIRLGYVPQSSAGTTIVRGMKNDGTTEASLIKWNSDAANNLTFGASPAGVDAITRLLLKATSYTFNIAAVDEYTFDATTADFKTNTIVNPLNIQFPGSGVSSIADGYIRIPNNTRAVVARDNANSSDVNLLGINSSNNIVLGHVPVKDETPGASQDGYVWAYNSSNSRMEISSNNITTSIWWGGTTLNSTSRYAIPFRKDLAVVSSEATGQVIASKNGTLRNFAIVLGGSIGAGTYTFVLNKNGTSTGLTVSMTAPTNTYAIDTTHTATVNYYDVLSVKCTAVPGDTGPELWSSVQL